MTAPRTPPSTARSGAHDPATVFVRTVAEAVRQSKIAVQNDPAPLANPLTAGTHLTGGSYNGSVSVIFATDATSANTASTIVARDASGNFVAGTITAALSGNASTATALQTPRTINGTSFDGTASIVVTAAAGTLTGTTLNATVVTSSLTSLGTLTGLTVKGTVAIAGASSGSVSFVAQAAAGSTTYVLPNADGINNDVLTTDGSGNLTWSVKAGGGGGTISTINGDGSAAQTIAAGAGLTIGNAGAVHTFALDLNYAPTYTTTITAAGFAGPLTGNVTGNLTGTVLTASQPDITTAANLTTIGTLVAGAVPASLVTAGTFGASTGGGNYAFPALLTVGGALSVIDAQTSLSHGLKASSSDQLVVGTTDLMQLIVSNATNVSMTVQAIEQGISNRALILNPLGGAVGVGGDFSVATSKFTVAAATGNTTVGGTLVVTSTIGASNFSGTSSGTNTGDQTDISGNAATATKVGHSLTAGTHLAGGPFDGSGAVTLTTDATSADTASTIVARDGSGDFSAGIITAALTGNATTATTLATARAINGVNFDGSAAITVTAAAGTLTGTTLNATVVTSSLTSVGASLTVAGGNFTVDAAGNIGAGTISAATGNFQVNALGKITSQSVPASVLVPGIFAHGNYAFDSGSILTMLTGSLLGVPEIVDAALLPTSAGSSGRLWVDTTGGLNIVKRA